MLYTRYVGSVVDEQKDDAIDSVIDKLKEKFRGTRIYGRSVDVDNPRDLLAACYFYYEYMKAFGHSE